LNDPFAILASNNRGRFVAIDAGIRRLIVVQGAPCANKTANFVAHAGDRIRTVEGLAGAAALHPVQAAFIAHDGFQCGYCTSGQICSAVAMLVEARGDTISAATADVRRKGPVELTDAEIRERMSGNLCRCGAYVGIVAAVRDAAKRV